MNRSSTGRVAASSMSVLLAAGAGVPALAQSRTYDGTSNNILHPSWGAAVSELDRMCTADYVDGIGEMPRGAVAGPREVSNAVAAQTGLIFNSRQLSDMAWQWGQFIDHDMDRTPTGSEAAFISTPVSDPYFHGSAIPFTRSVYDGSTGVSTPRQQMNMITSYIDGSQVYGSSSDVADGLRAHVGGRLRTSSHPTGDLLPYNTTGLPNDPGPMGGDPASFFVAGDVRANEQSGLTAMQTLWMREHNRWADSIAAANPSWNDEEVFQRARRIVGAEIEAITYNGWLPALLGGGAMPAYAGYDPNVDAGVSTEFSTAAFRIGHSMLSSTLLRLDNNGNVIPEGNLSLQQSFFNPGTITEAGIDPILHGLAAQAAQEIDTRVVDDVRNFLFGPPGSGGMDLAALNIQRGRDHGLPGYNSIREQVGLDPVTSFADITSDPETQAALASVYADVNEIDPWVGMLAEDHLPGSSVGELMSLVIVDQFERARAGDRFFYLNDPALADMLGYLNGLTLGDIILANTSITRLQGNVFFVPGPGSLVLVAVGGLLSPRRRPKQSTRNRG